VRHPRASSDAGIPQAARCFLLDPLAAAGGVDAAGATDPGALAAAGSALGTVAVGSRLGVVQALANASSARSP
jgi:hypothetical protein